MKILADENCERGMVDALRADGHDVVTMLDISPSADDDTVFELAQSESRILLTNDHDFGIIAERAGMRPPAIVLMRLEPLFLSRRIEVVRETFAGLGESLAFRFIGIEPHQVRMRVYEP